MELLVYVRDYLYVRELQRTGVVNMPIKLEPVYRIIFRCATNSTVATLVVLIGATLLDIAYEGLAFLRRSASIFFNYLLERIKQMFS